jgi:hypothetical protein
MADHERIVPAGAKSLDQMNRHAVRDEIGAGKRLVEFGQPFDPVQHRLSTTAPAKIRVCSAAGALPILVGAEDAAIAREKRSSPRRTTTKSWS